MLSFSHIFLRIDILYLIPFLLSSLLPDPFLFFFFLLFVSALPSPFLASLLPISPLSPSSLSHSSDSWLYYDIWYLSRFIGHEREANSSQPALPF
jgi:hypothetical protein